MTKTDELLAHLEAMGWMRSCAERRSVDNDGLPLPWYVYPAISFLTRRVRKTWNVFEYGSGNSTLWWSERVASVTSVEHNATWYEYVKTSARPNVEYVHREPGEAYFNEILSHERRFEVIVVDGQDRNECAKTAPERLSPDGVVIWDNSELRRYDAGLHHLRDEGFRRIDFEGFGPALSRPWMTSVLYRDGNCLGI